MIARGSFVALGGQARKPKRCLMVAHKSMSCVAVLATGLIVGLSSSLAVTHGQAVTAVSSAPRDVTFCEVANEPLAFDGARVRVTSMINFNFEDFRLWDPTCLWSKSGSGLWLTYGGQVNSGAIYCCPGEGPPRSSPLPYPLVEDPEFLKFRALLTKNENVVVRATLVGTLRTQREGKAIESFTGYGHFGCCSLFVIERVESFEPHSRKDLDYSASFSGGTFPCKGTGGVQGELKTADGHPFAGVSFDGGELLIREQAAAEAGERAWAFVEPSRVALEAVRRVNGDAVLRRVKSTQSQVVFEWKRARNVTTVVVARPYWLSFYAKSTRVAWVVTSMETAWCD